MQIGEKIKYMRLSNQLTQEEVAARCELSKGFISQVERNMTSPSIATLRDILECLGTDLQHFFHEESEDKIVFGQDDYAIKEDPELGNSVCWLIPNAQKNKMEPIVVTIAPGGQTYPDIPHEGEEFGYVLAGAVTVVLGQKRVKAKKGESFIVCPETPHYLENKGKKTAKILWVSTPPSF